MRWQLLLLTAIPGLASCRSVGSEALTLTDDDLVPRSIEDTAHRVYGSAAVGLARWLAMRYEPSQIAEAGPMPHDDARQLEELYRRFGGAVYSRCRRLLMDSALAEDAVQEVFLRTCKHRPTFASDDDARRWLWRVSTNHCLNVLRFLHRRNECDEVTERLPRIGLSQEDRLLGKDVVRRLLLEMPKELQAAAVLYYLDDLDQKEVAEVLGVSSRTVISWLQRFAERAHKLKHRLGLS